jgi:hypothetical protein
LLFSGLYFKKKILKKNFKKKRPRISKKHRILPLGTNKATKNVCGKTFTASGRSPYPCILLFHGLDHQHPVKKYFCAVYRSNLDEGIHIHPDHLDELANRLSHSTLLHRNDKHRCEYNTIQEQVIARRPKRPNEGRQCPRTFVLHEKGGIKKTKTGQTAEKGG